MIKKSILISVLIFAVVVLTFFSCQQEKMIFHPDKLPADYKYSFKNDFTEYFFDVDDKTKINGLLFKSSLSKGLIFYLHGNAGALDSWGTAAEAYLQLGYDFFVLDYRGYGKSEGRISSETQLYNDVQLVYDSLKKKYEEKNIVIIGYSIGTGVASHLASVNKPRLLILQAPFYNMRELAHDRIKLFPSFLIRYKFKTNENIQKLSCPLAIFHGDRDETIDYSASVELSKLLRPIDTFITLKGQMHNGINENEVYRKELSKLLD